nr:acyl-CoA dehydrogenase family protein [Myxococcus sp. CA040A]
MRGRPRVPRSRESHVKTNSRSAVLQAVRELAPSLSARGAEIELARRIPADVIGLLKSAGVFRMFVPRSHGGLDLALLEGLEVLEELGRIDGSLGWTTMIGVGSPHLFAVLPRSEFDAIHAASPDIVAAGAMAAQGEARTVAGGYRVTGRWNFATGCHHSDWFYGSCALKDESGKPVMGTDGKPALRTVLVPASSARILDNWQVLGMRGSGSHDISVEDVFVPEAYAFDVAAARPCHPSPHFVAPPLQISLHIGAVAVGIAQAALDDVVALAKAGKKRLYARHTLRESPQFQHRLGRAQSDLRAARALLQELSGRFWTTCVEAPDSASGFAPEILSTTAWLVDTAAEVVSACYRASGTSPVRDGSTLQRRFRDIHVLTQHASATDGWFAQAGSTLLGFDFALES